MSIIATAPGARKSRDFSRIRVLANEDAKKAALTLYDSFQTDSLAKMLTNHIKDPAYRREVDIFLYECYLRQHIAKGVCLGIGESESGFETVAVWSTPTSVDEGLDDFPTLMDAGYGKLWEMSGKEGQEKIFKGMLPLLHDSFNHIMATDSRFADKGVYTLVYLGSLASARGKGNVRLMFEYMFERYIDLPNTNHIAYLESSSATNIPIYNKFGFLFYKDIMLGSRSNPAAKEGEDFAVMNVMIRGPYGESWETFSPAKL